MGSVPGVIVSLNIFVLSQQQLQQQLQSAGLSGKRLTQHRGQVCCWQVGLFSASLETCLRGYGAPLLQAEQASSSRVTNVKRHKFLQVCSCESSVHLGRLCEEHSAGSFSISQEVISDFMRWIVAAITTFTAAPLQTSAPLSLSSSKLKNRIKKSTEREQHYVQSITHSRQGGSAGALSAIVSACSADQ